MCSPAARTSSTSPARRSRRSAACARRGAGTLQRWLPLCPWPSNAAAMQNNTLKPKTPRTRSQRVGRGGKRGKTPGRGTKGQNARAGRKKRPEMRDIIKKIPKLRGRGKSSLKSIRQRNIAINLSAVSRAFSAGEVVSPSSLKLKGLIGSSKSALRIKILSSGDITKKLTFNGCDISAGAQEK